MRKLVGFLFLLFLSMPYVVLADIQEELEIRNELNFKYNDFFINETVANQCLHVFDSFENIYNRAKAMAQAEKDYCLQEGRGDCDAQYLINLEHYGLQFIEKNAQRVTWIDCPNARSIQTGGNGDRIVKDLQRFPNLIYVNLENNAIHSDVTLSNSIETFLF